MDKSPAYVRISTAAAMTIKIFPGQFNRGEKLGCLNLLIHYPRSVERLMNCEWKILLSDPVVMEIVDAFFEKYSHEGPFSPEDLLDNLEIDYYSDDNDRETDDFSDSEDEFDLDRKVRPGTLFRMSFDIENLFDNNYDEGDFDEVTLTIESDDNDLFAE